MSADLLKRRLILEKEILEFDERIEVLEKPEPPQWPIFDSWISEIFETL